MPTPFLMSMLVSIQLKRAFFAHLFFNNEFKMITTTTIYY